MQIKSSILILLLICVFSFSCKKRQAFNNEDGQSSVDVITSQSENGDVMSDVNMAIGDQGILRGKSGTIAQSLGVFPSPCDLKVDTLEIVRGILKLNYTGVVCKNRKREGTVLITTLNYPLKKWKNKGCVLTIQYLNYKVTNTNSGKTVSIKGTINLTNENGGTWYDLWFTSLPSLVYTMSANDLQFTFDGNTTLHSISRKLTYTYKSNGKITTCVIEGVGTRDGKNNVDGWGQNRDGDSYVSQITTPIKWSTNCGTSAPIEGVLRVKVDKKEFELVSNFAVDQNGNDVTDNINQCPYGWKLSWTYKKKTNTRIFPYN